MCDGRRRGCGRTLKITILFQENSHSRTGEEITMRTLENAIIATILILFGQPVHAGVVMSETEVQRGLGDSTTTNKTVYVQGKKQKIETSHDERILTSRRECSMKSTQAEK